MIKLRQLREELQEMGFEASYSGRAHETWSDPGQPKRRIVLTGIDGTDSLKHQLTKVRRFRRGTMIYE